jgi:hypothetical protein
MDTRDVMAPFSSADLRVFIKHWTNLLRDRHRLDENERDVLLKSISTMEDEIGLRSAPILEHVAELKKAGYFDKAEG